ncbi:MAG: hypothetical protein R2712_18460 [Vicinamibacterales bacterium]
MGGDLGKAAKGAVIGVMQGTHQLGSEAVMAVGSTVQNLVRTTSEVGGDVGVAAQHAMEGAIEGSRSIGTKGVDAVSATPPAPSRASATSAVPQPRQPRTSSTSSSRAPPGWVATSAPPRTAPCWAWCVAPATSPVRRPKPCIDRRSGGEGHRGCRRRHRDDRTPGGRGAIDGAKETGVDAAAAASAAATGALRAAGDISAEAVEQVQRTATGLISGVKVVVTAPFKA